MTDQPRRTERRRASFEVEPLEGRTLLSAARTLSAPSRTKVVVSPASYQLNQQQGSLTVDLHLRRTGASGTTATLTEPLTVDFTASGLSHAPVGGDGEADALFAPYHTTVTFPAGASTRSVTVPIVSTKPATEVARVTLEAKPSAESRVAAGAVAAMPLYVDADAAPPTIASVQPVLRGKLASAVVVGFSKPMDEAAVEDPSNYRILSRPMRSSSSGLLFWGGSSTTEIHSFPIATASYDPATWKVTLTLKRPTRASSLYEVASAHPLRNHHLTDTKGLRVVSPASADVAVMTEGFTNLIQPIPGVVPNPVRALKTTVDTNSFASSLNPFKAFG